MPKTYDLQKSSLWYEGDMHGLVQFGQNLVQEMCTKVYWVADFHESWCSESHNYLVAYMNFSQFLLSDLDEINIIDLHVMLLIIYEFFEKWHREDHTFLIGIEEITFTYVMWDNKTFWKKRV